MSEQHKSKFVKDFLEDATQKFTHKHIEMKSSLERTAEALWEVNIFTISPIDEPAFKQNLDSILEE